MAFQDPNAAALAAGAKPGQSVTIGGSTFTVTAPKASTTSGDPNNKRYPDSQIKPEYPYAKATVHPDGSGRYDDHTPGHETFREFFSGGGHREVGNSPDGGIGREVIATLGKVFHNLADGLSQTVAGHNDKTTGGNHRDQVEGDKHEEKGGNHYHMVGGHEVKSSNETQVHHTAGGDKHQITSGDIIADHDGSIHNNIKKDIINHIGANYGFISAGGDYSLHLNAGNFNIEAPSGKYNLNTLSDITITSTTNITLKVGSSTIEIKPDGITITASAVSFKKA